MIRTILVALDAAPTARGVLAEAAELAAPLGARLVLFRAGDMPGDLHPSGGPFASRRVAESFANALVDFGRFETLSERVVTEPQGVFVEVTRHRP